jgi:hypothetical protein
MDTQLIAGLDISACFHRLHICNQIKFPQKRPKPQIASRLKLGLLPNSKAPNKSLKQLSAVFFNTFSSVD